MSFFIRKDEIEWKPHPLARGVKIKPLLTRKEHNADVTCILVLTRKGLEIPEHSHEQDDLLYILSGEAEMWIEKIGSFKLQPGTFIRVRKGTKHKIYKVTKDLLVYDIFSPAIM